MIDQKIEDRAYESPMKCQNIQITTPPPPPRQRSAVNEKYNKRACGRENLTAFTVFNAFSDINHRIK